jgi:arylsulfatase A-like enzyme
MDHSYPVELRKAGYYTGFFGKFGVIYPEFKGLFDEGESYDRNDKFKDARGYYKTVGKDSVHLTRYTGQKAIDFIQHAPKDKPFMFSLSFSAPHGHDPSEQQYFWSPQFDTMYRGITIPDPPLKEDAYFQALPSYVRNGENRRRWKYLRYINDPAHEELYDLKMDPSEKTNLAKDSTYQAIKNQLKGGIEKLISGYTLPPTSSH